MKNFEGEKLSLLNFDKKKKLAINKRILMRIQHKFKKILKKLSQILWNNNLFKFELDF